MIEESENLKSETETRALHLADRRVPYSFLFTGAVWLLTFCSGAFTETIASL